MVWICGRLASCFVLDSSPGDLGLTPCPNFENRATRLAEDRQIPSCQDCRGWSLPMASAEPIAFGTPENPRRGARLEQLPGTCYLVTRNAWNQIAIIP